METRRLILLVLVVISTLAQTAMTQAQGPRPTFGDSTPSPLRCGQDPGDQQIEFVAQTGGIADKVYAVAVKGDYAYVGVKARLHVLDVSDPAHYVFLGRSSWLGGTIQDVAVSGHYAYVAAGNAGLIIVDVSDPEDPAWVRVHKTAGECKGVTVAAQHAYVAVGQAGLRIINVSDPTHPAEAGAYDTAGEAWDVAVQGDYAYLADDEGGLRIINVSDPAHPTVIGSFEIPAHAPWDLFPDGSGRARAVAVRGDYAYVAYAVPTTDFYWGNLVWCGGLSIINVSNPQHATEACASSYVGARAWSVTLAGDLAYLATGDQGLRILNVSDPTACYEVGSHEPPGYARQVAVAGRHAYLAGEEGGLRILDVTYPAAPTQASYYNTSWSAKGVAVGKSGHAYVAAEWETLHTVDVSDPTRPTEAGSWYASQGWGHAVAVAGSHAYLAAGFAGLRIIDVSDPKAPRGLASRGGNAEDVIVAGDHAYVDDWDDLSIVDISDPAHPTEVGSYETAGDIEGLASAGDYAYVAEVPRRFTGSGERVLRILDVSDPTQPTEAGSLPMPGDPHGVAVEGGRAYVAAGSGLHIVDVSAPEHPSELGSLLEGCSDVSVAGDYAYVVSGRRIRLIDVADPTQPSEVDGYATAVDAEDVTVSGGYAYAASGDGGLLILRSPCRDKVTRSIVPTGGQLISSSGDASFLFPNGAFAATADLTYHRHWSDQDTAAWMGIGHTFDLSAVYPDTGQPAQLAPGQTYTVSVHYSEASVGPAIEGTLGLCYWDGSQWVKEPSSSVDAEANMVGAVTNHLGLWAVLGHTRRLFLPTVGRSH